MDKSLEEILDFSSSEDNENENEQNNFLQLNTVVSNEARNMKQSNFIGMLFLKTFYVTVQTHEVLQF